MHMYVDDMRFQKFTVQTDRPSTRIMVHPVETPGHLEKTHKLRIGG